MSEPKPEKWFIRKPDGSVYGPETLEVLCEWAAECRVVAGNQVSRDKHTWTAVENVPELKMEWVAELPDGRKYGPFHLMATHELHKHEVLPPESKLINRHTGESRTVEELVSEKKLHRQKPLFDMDESANEGQQELLPGKNAGRKSRGRKRVQETSEGTDDNDSSTETAPSMTEQIDEGKNPENLEVTGRNTAPTEDIECLMEGEPVVSHDEGLQEPPDKRNTPIAENYKEDPEPVILEPGDEQEETPAQKQDETQPIVSETLEKPLRDDTEVVPPVLKTADNPEFGGSGSVPTASTGGFARSSSETDTETTGAIKELERKVAALEAALAAEREMFETRQREAADALELLEKRMEEQAEEHQRDRDEWTKEQNELEQELSTRKELCDVEQQEISEMRKRLAESDNKLRKQDELHHQEIAKWQTRVKNMEHENSSMRIAVERTSSRGPFANAGIILLLTGLVISLVTCFRSKDDDTDIQTEETAATATERDYVPHQARTAMDPEPIQRITQPRQQIETTRIAEINVSGLNVEWIGPNCRITFSEPPFAQLDRLTARGIDQLNSLARQLMPHSSQYRMLITGYTDNQPLSRNSRFADNRELATARARAAAATMQNSGLPDSMMIVRGGSEENAPHPNDTAESRRMNRTVVIELIKL